VAAAVDERAPRLPMTGRRTSATENADEHDPDGIVLVGDAGMSGCRVPRRAISGGRAC
jgi:hypothetical protein